MQIKIRQIQSMLLVLSLLAISQLSHTANVLKEINLELYGNIRAFACTVMSPENNKTVDLGKQNTKNLSSKGDRSTATPIELKLTNCPPNGTVNISVIGSLDKIDNQLLAIDEVSGSAKNVAIEIKDKDKKRLPMGTKTTGLKTDSVGNFSTVFYANYIVTKLGTTAGSANSKMQFSIEYE